MIIYKIHFIWLQYFNLSFKTFKLQKLFKKKKCIMYIMKLTLILNSNKKKCFLSFKTFVRPREFDLILHYILKYSF